MSERTPKQPLNDPEYTVPEYSVLLPSDEAENSTVESSAAEDNAPGDSAPEHASTPEQATTGYREATADYTATVSAEQVIPKRPQAMRSVIWCATAMIALGTLSNFLRVMLPWQSYIDFEMVVRTLFSMLAFTLFASIIPIFILWKVWDGREWARILTIIGNAFAVANGVLIFANNFTDSRYSSRAIGGSSYSASYLVDTVSGTLMFVLHILMIVLLTRAPIRMYTQVVSGARALEHRQMMSETRQAAGQVPAELREIFADDEDGERTSSGENTPRPPHRSAGWGT